MVVVAVWVVERKKHVVGDGVGGVGDLDVMY